MNKKSLIAIPFLIAAYFLYRKTQQNSVGQTSTGSSAVNLINSNSILDTILNGVNSVTLSTSGKRGIRNNNPGNIRLGSAWQGMREEQTDGSFVQFTDPKYGIRAMTRIIDNYKKRGVKTISQIISTWAPSNENNTAAYINSVAKKTGWPSFYIPEKSRGDYLPLIKAIIYHENGEQPYSDAVINEGIGLA